MLTLEMIVITGVLAGVNVVLAASVIVLFRRLRQQKDQFGKSMESLQKKLQDLNVQVEVLTKGSLGVGKRLMVAEKRLNQTMERQEEIENKDLEKISFSQAAKLLESGVAINEVVEKVGVSRSEAKLMELFSVGGIREDRELELID